MEQQKILLRKEGREAMEILARLKNPEAALLYAFAAANDGCCTDEQACAGLGYTPQQAKKARENLLVYGLAASGVLPPPRKDADYDPAELAQAREGDPAFSGLCTYFETALGHVLNRRELETLLNVYEALSLPPDVLTMLIGYCRRRGRLSARELEKQAYWWYDHGIDTYEKAAAFLERQQEKSSRGAQVLQLFDIRDHLPGESEQAYIDRWTEQGFSDELLRLAYDKTLMGAHRMSWPYLDKILQNWHEKGYRTPEQVAAGDARPSGAATSRTEAAETVEAMVLRRFQQRRQQRALELERRLTELRNSSEEFSRNESGLRLCASRMARATGERRRQLEADYRVFLNCQTQLLQQLGKPADWLADRPDCPKCGDRGYVGTQKCSCLLEACKKAAQESAAAK